MSLCTDSTGAGYVLVCDACGEEVAETSAQSAYWTHLEIGDEEWHACGAYCVVLVLRQVADDLAAEHGFDEDDEQLAWCRPIVDVATGGRL